MKNHFADMMHAQKGYTQMEEGKVSSESEKVYAPLRSSTRGLASWTELGWRLICGLMFIGGASMLAASQRSLKVSDRACATQLSVWSPLLEAVEYENREWVSIFETPSRFVGTPSRHLEKTWHDYLNVPAVLVPAERVASLNRSMEQGFVEAERKYSGYVAGVEVYHHLHCLNVVRQWATQDEYPEGLRPSLLRHNSRPVARAHVDHCIETIRDALTCNADLTPYLYYKHKGEGKGPAREDFQAIHKCKNFDRIREWIDENGIDIPYDSLAGNA